MVKNKETNERVYYYTTIETADKLYEIGRHTEPPELSISPKYTIIFLILSKIQKAATSANEHTQKGYK
ncbi:MAG: hypothetical protein ABI045_02180 [Flavobacteriales bacterium]